MITSLSNARVKEVVKLRETRGRRKQQRMVIDGVRELTRALRGGVVPSELFHAPALYQSAAQEAEIAALLTQLQAAGCELLETSPAVFQKLAFGERAEGVVGVAPLPARPLSAWDLPPGALVAVLVGIEKPGNIGAILRSADGAGVSGVIVADAATDLFNPNTIRSSLGTIFTLPIATATSREALEWLRRREARILATRVEGAERYSQVSYEGEVAIVLGSEDVGLSEIWQGPDITGVSLPMLGVADSLNVSNTAAILCYEALRQRQA